MKLQFFLIYVNDVILKTDSNEVTWHEMFMSNIFIFLESATKPELKIHFGHKTDKQNNVCIHSIHKIITKPFSEER